MRRIKGKLDSVMSRVETFLEEKKICIRSCPDEETVVNKSFPSDTGGRKVRSQEVLFKGAHHEIDI